MENIVKSYYDWMKTAIDEEGISLPHAFIIDADGHVTMMAFDIDLEQAYVMVIQAVIKGAVEAIFASDRFTKEGQGTTLGDVMAGHHFKDGNWNPFIIEYQHEPRIVKPIEWDNEFWNRALHDELAQVTHRHRLEITASILKSIIDPS